MTLRYLPVVLIASLFLCGCTGGIRERAKTIWGSSTRALEEARTEAIAKTYDCTFDECFDAALVVAAEQKYVVFLNDKRKKHIVIMGVPGSIDTTEVGIFFTEVADRQVKIEVSSLSTNAKRNVAETLFDRLFKPPIVPEVPPEDVPEEKPAVPDRPANAL